MRPVIFARNFGHQIAVTAGMDYSRGQAVMIIDADLQDPPEVMLDLIGKWREGYEVVYAVRSEREGESAFKLKTASMFYRTINKLTDIDIPMDTGDFRLLDRKVVNVLNNMRERHRFLRGMGAWVGFKSIGVEYKRAARHAGVTKYPLKKMLKLALNAVTSFSFVPLQIATYIGLISAAVAILGIPLVVILRVLRTPQFTGQATTLIMVLFLGGVQLISLGIIGEYIARIYDEVRGRPLYIVAEGPSEAHSPTARQVPRCPNSSTHPKESMMARINLEKNKEVLEHALERVRQKGIIIPTLAQQQDPERLVPQAIKDKLKDIGLWDLHPLNLFRITWKNEPKEFGGQYGGVNFIELPQSLTGVEARIVALLGKWFPTGAHKVGAAFGCLVPPW